MRTALLVIVAACGSDPSDTPMHDATEARDGQPTDAAVSAHLVAYVSGNAANINVYDFDLASGALTMTGSAAAFAANPSFLAMTRTHLYAVSENASRIGAYAIDPGSGALTFINDQASGGSGPAHLSVDRSGRYVLAANYGDGHVAVLPVRADGGVNAAVSNPLPGMNAHEILTDAANQFAFVPCLGSDYIAQYRFDAASGALTPNSVATVATATNAGPRHLAFAPDGAFAYLIDETASTLQVLAYDAASGRLTAVQSVSNRKAGATGNNTGAEIVVHPSGKYVYASNRGDNNVSAFAIGGDGKVTLIGHVPVGATPRNFTIDPTGAWMIVANQDANTVTTYRIDPATGMPAPTGASMPFTKPTFVGLVSL